MLVNRYFPIVAGKPIQIIIAENIDQPPTRQPDKISKSALSPPGPRREYLRGRSSLQVAALDKLFPSGWRLVESEVGYSLAVRRPLNIFIIAVLVGPKEPARLLAIWTHQPDLAVTDFARVCGEGK